MSYYKLQQIRYRLIDARRLVKSLELREQREFDRLDVMTGTQAEAAERHSMSIQQIRTVRSRITRAACVGLLLLTVGCETSRPRRPAPPMPPMPAAAMRSEAQTATFAEAVIGPPAVKQFRLMWAKGAGADSTEIHATTDLKTWSLLADVTGEEYPFFASGGYRFFKIRSKQVETYSVSNYHTGQWEQVTRTNYSIWAK